MLYVEWWENFGPLYFEHENLNRQYLIQEGAIYFLKSNNSIYLIWFDLIKDECSYDVKFSKFQNEFMKSSFLPKYEQKMVMISVL